MRYFKATYSDTSYRMHGAKASAVKNNGRLAVLHSKIAMINIVGGQSFGELVAS